MVRIAGDNGGPYVGRSRWHASEDAGQMRFPGPDAARTKRMKAMDRGDAFRRLAIAAGLVYGCAGSADAQLVLGSDVSFATRSVWRGLTRVSAPVFQPAAYIALRAGPGFVTAGAWGDYELGNTEPGDMSFAGIGESGFGAVEAWVEIAARLALWDWRVGYVHMRFRNDERVVGIPSDLETSEIYAIVGSRHLPVVLELGAWQDIDAVNGRYFELDVAYPLPTNPLGTIVGSIFVGGRLGLVNGQGREPIAADAPDDTYYFAENGFSHVDLYAEWSFDIPVTWLPLDLFLSLHHEFAIDEVARREYLLSTESQSRFWWFEAAASIGVGIGRGAGR